MCIDLKEFNSYKDYLKSPRSKKIVKTYVEGPKELWEAFKNPAFKKIGYKVMGIIFRELKGLEK